MLVKTLYDLYMSNLALRGFYSFLWLNLILLFCNRLVNFEVCLHWSSIMNTEKRGWWKGKYLPLELGGRPSSKRIGGIGFNQGRGVYSDSFKSISKNVKGGSNELEVWISVQWVRKWLLAYEKELSLCHKSQFSNTYISKTRWHKPLIFQTLIVWSISIYSLKYLGSTTLGYRDKGINKSEFVTMTQFL